METIKNITGSVAEGANFFGRANEIAKALESLDDGNNLVLAKKIDFSDEHINYMLEKLGWYLPYFIQILFQEIIELVRDGKTLSNSTVDDAYKNLLNRDIYFRHWTERLIYYEDEQRLARIVLNELSRGKDGKQKEQLYALVFSEMSDADKSDKIFMPLLNLLEVEGYIIKNDADKYSFRSPLLRDFWFHQFGE
jgi:hypothetical protein